VLGETTEAARLGAAAVEVDYEPLPSLITVAEAIAAGPSRGRPGLAPGRRRGGARRSGARLRGHHENLGQEHFYLETHASLAYYDESGQLFIQCSTQHPGEAQAIVAHVLGLTNNAITVQSLRMGGGFGGKETQPHGSPPSPRSARP
jgi:xanthine dehydrogenase large subunit